MHQSVSHPFLVHESADEYHAHARHHLSSHQLADFRKCPQLYYRKKTQPPTRDESPAYLVGRAAHVLILEGFERFREDFAVGGPINPRTGQPFGPATKAWTEWAEAIGKPVISDSQFDIVERMNESVLTHTTAVELLQQGIAEGVVRAEYCGLPCQIRMDWFEPVQGIVDLKTCDDLTWFEADSRRYLCPLVSKSGKDQIDFGSLHIRGGEFVADEVEALMDRESLVESVCREIVQQTENRNAVLIFSSGVRHGEHIVDTLRANHGIECGFVTGESSSEDRDRLLQRFRAGDLKYLCNVNVLTTGFDAPNIDCVALVRPTSSAGLFSQCVGRGFRLHPSKQNCLVLDFGGNVLRHGPVDCLRIKPAGSQSTGEAPAKQCPRCNALIAMGYSHCPECGFAFPPPEKQNHEAQATQAPILSGQVTNTRYEVTDTHYYSHLKRGASEDAPRSLRVDYMIGWRTHKSEWVCFEHSGYARQRAVAWWKQRSHDPVPTTTEEALARIEGGALAPTQAIVVRSVSGEEFERIVDYELGPMPEPMEHRDFSCEFSDEEIPF